MSTSPTSTVKAALAPDDAPQHKKIDRSLLARLWSYMRPYRHWVWLSVGISLAMTLLKVIQPWMVKSIIDNEIATRDTMGVARKAALLLASILAAGAAEAAFDYLTTWFGQK